MQFACLVQKINTFKYLTWRCKRVEQHKANMRNYLQSRRGTAIGREIIAKDRSERHNLN